MDKLAQDIRRRYERGDRRQARAAIEDAVRDRSASALLAHSLGALAEEFFDSDAAIHAYAQPVARSPNNPEHRTAYAAALTRFGEFALAEAQLREAIAVDETHAPSYFQYSIIHRATPDDPLVNTLEDLLARPGLAPADQYAYRLALGKFYDDIGEYDNAFAQFSAAKAQPRINYDHDAQKAFFERIKNAFRAAFLQSKSGVGDASPAPVFIVGMPRSGSSLLETMLTRDPRIAALGERIEMSLVTQNMAERNNAEHGYLDILQRAPDAEFARCGADYRQRLAPVAQGAERHIDKNLLNFQRVGFIRLALPNATVVHARRNALDVCLSCYFQTFDPAIYPFTFDLANVGRYYAIYADLMRHWEDVLKGRVAAVDYEDMISAPEETTAQLYEAMKLAPAEASAPANGRNGVVATASAWQARQPLFETSVKRWKNYENHLGALLKALEQSGLQHPDE